MNSDATPSKLKVAAVQMVSGADVGLNLRTAAHWVGQAAAQGARLVALPEYFCLIGQHDEDKLAIAETAGLGPIQQALADMARQHGVWLNAGTLPLKTDAPDRVFNSNLVFAPDGQLAARYDKLHLFAFDNGRERYDEGRVLRAGSAPARVALPDLGLHMGLSVCYDLRFPELYRGLNADAALPPCDLLCVPAAFTHTTGQAHWELLLRARAVENQCYVLAAAQGGQHDNGRRTFGHSMVVDPWGSVLAVLAEGPGLVLADIDLQHQQRLRRQLPALAHRRLGGGAAPTSA